jgi:hypothetical protein
MKTDPPPESDAHFASDDDPRYRRAARLLAQKLGVDWRSLPPEQVHDYLRKIEIAETNAPRKPRP